MATGNTGYTTASGVAYAGQPAYTAYATEIVVAKRWANAWLRKSPLYAKIVEGKTKFNKQGLRKGNAILIPVTIANASQTADGRADSAELTPLSAYATGAEHTQAQFEIAHYVNNMTLRASEQELVNNTRGNLLDAKINNLIDGFINAIADDLASTSADSREKVLGIQYAIATANSPGKIDQSVDLDWASQVSTAVGAFSLDLIDDKIDAVTPRGGETDLILLSHSSSNNLFGKLRSALAPSERIVNADFKAKAGFNNIEYLGATCVSDNRLTAGVICGLDTSSWYWVGDTAPKQVDVSRLPGTDSREFFYSMWCAVGIDAPQKQWRLTGVS